MANILLLVIINVGLSVVMKNIMTTVVSIYKVPNSPQCNTSGTYECGICSCDKGFYGKKCECGATNLEDNENDLPCRL